MAAMLASSYDVTTRFHELDGTRRGEGERLLR
jgi:hypothetical protein